MILCAHVSSQLFSYSDDLLPAALQCQMIKFLLFISYQVYIDTYPYTDICTLSPSSCEDVL